MYTNKLKQYLRRSA